MYCKVESEKVHMEKAEEASKNEVCREAVRNTDFKESMEDTSTKSPVESGCVPAVPCQPEPANASAAKGEPSVSSGAKKFLVHKCITILAKQQPCCLPLSSLREMLSKNIQDLQEKALIELILEHSDLFCLTKEMHVQLKPVDTRAAEQLLKLGQNVAVSEDKIQLLGEKQHDLTVWASANTLILDGLQGRYYNQTPDSVLVFSFDTAQLRVTFASSPEMAQQLCEGQRVRVFLKSNAFGKDLVQVYPLTLTTKVAGGRCLKMMTPMGEKFKSNEKLAIQISPGAELLPEVNLMFFTSNYSFNP